MEVSIALFYLGEIGVEATKFCNAVWDLNKPTNHHTCTNSLLYLFLCTKKKSRFKIFFLHINPPPPAFLSSHRNFLENTTLPCLLLLGSLCSESQIHSAEASTTLHLHQHPHFDFSLSSFVLLALSLSEY